MARRLISIFAALALVAAVMAGTGEKLSARAPDCCNGAMCPMHHNGSPAVACDMDMSHTGAALKSCPDQGTHYTASLTFVRVAPLARFAERMIEPARVFAPAVAPHVIPSIDSPPPRSIVA
jgi:hypothetical protein